MKQKLTEEQVKNAREAWLRTHEGLDADIHAMAPYVQYPVEIPKGLAVELAAMIGCSSDSPFVRDITSICIKAFVEAQKPESRFTVKRREASPWWDVSKGSSTVDVATFSNESDARDFCDRKNKEAESD